MSNKELNAKIQECAKAVFNLKAVLSGLNQQTKTFSSRKYRRPAVWA